MAKIQILTIQKDFSSSLIQDVQEKVFPQIEVTAGNIEVLLRV